MWYKYNEDNNEWYFGSEIHLPNGIILKDNHEETIDDWFWSDIVPFEIEKEKENII